MTQETAREIATRLRERMQCNCDLDNWEPERSTGHSCVCRIHKQAMADFRCQKATPATIPNPQGEPK